MAWVNGTWVPDSDTYQGIQSFSAGAPGIGSPSIMQQGPANPYGSAPGGGEFGSDALGILGNLPGSNANGSGFGWNVPTLNAGINGIAQLGGLYLGLKQLGLAKDTFKFQKQAYKTDLANRTSAYNTQVSDRISGRSYGTKEERDAALAAAQLPTGG